MNQKARQGSGKSTNHETGASYKNAKSSSLSNNRKSMNNHKASHKNLKEESKGQQYLNQYFKQ